MEGKRVGLVAVLVLFCCLETAWAQEEKKEKKIKARDVEAVISGVGQRTVTFQYERKEKIREEVVQLATEIDALENSLNKEIRSLRSRATRLADLLKQTEL